ncbi:MAG: PTS IIA-like nitrogen regulatory protein PtsN [Pseudomonadota bacterium]
MGIGHLIGPDAVFGSVEAHSKKQAIQEISSAAAKLTSLSERSVFDTLLQRERLGSTGIGKGIAIPHGKLGNLDKLTGLFFRLAEPVPFDALDDEPVDLIFVLLAHEDAGADHLKALAKIARIMRTPNMAEDLRGAAGKTDLHALLTREPVNSV